MEKKAFSASSDAEGAESSGIAIVPGVIFLDALLKASSADLTGAPAPTTFSTAAFPTETLSPEQRARVESYMKVAWSKSADQMHSTATASQETALAGPVLSLHLSSDNVLAATDKPEKRAVTEAPVATPTTMGIVTGGSWASSWSAMTGQLLQRLLRQWRPRPR